MVAMVTNRLRVIGFHLYVMVGVGGAGIVEFFNLSHAFRI